jgi:hypothetical protein
LYRTGQIAQGRGLEQVPILAVRGTNNDDYHYPYRTVVMRQRLRAANGHADNHIYWIQPPTSAAESTLDAMDRWLTGIVDDTSGDPLSARVVRNRPVDVGSGCWIDGVKEGNLTRCDAVYPYASEPRTVAGDGPTISTIKCGLRALVREEYPVRFTDEEWRRLSGAFPSGVCDFSKPGVGSRPTLEWLSYRDGPGGLPLGPSPRSR